MLETEREAVNAAARRQARESALADARKAARWPLQGADPDALVDTRRRGVEYSMESDRPGMMMRKRLMALLTQHGEAEVHR